MKQIVFPAEWHPQSAVQLTWPHEQTDWAGMIDEVTPCFLHVAGEILKREKLIIVCHNEKEARKQLMTVDSGRIIYCQTPTNDTWARDHGGLSVMDSGRPVVYDFLFNGWGMKFAANHDNLITRNLFRQNVFAPGVSRADKQPFVLEGGSIETDGQGTLLTTAACLTSPNRNGAMSREQIDAFLKETFGARRILWLENGALEGDDTDAHIDTLARFCSPDTIAYVQCTDPRDTHFRPLRQMENELKALRQENGQPYRLIPLPMADRAEYRSERLPATYANFLVINGAVLFPCYGSPKDAQTARILAGAFPQREITGINCLPLIRQHGSLHCITMQYPLHFI
jgi:agmatine/peptidylarginine deiminase